MEDLLQKYLRLDLEWSPQIVTDIYQTVFSYNIELTDLSLFDGCKFENNPKDVIAWMKEYKIPHMTLAYSHHFFNKSEAKYLLTWLPLHLLTTQRKIDTKVQHNFYTKYKVLMVWTFDNANLNRLFYGIIDRPCLVLLKKKPPKEMTKSSDLKFNILEQEFFSRWSTTVYENSDWKIGNMKCQHSKMVKLVLMSEHERLSAELSKYYLPVYSIVVCRTQVLRDQTLIVPSMVYPEMGFGINGVLNEKQIGEITKNLRDNESLIIYVHKSLCESVENLDVWSQQMIEKFNTKLYQYKQMYKGFNMCQDVFGNHVLQKDYLQTILENILLSSNGPLATQGT
jgi:hypothetical protein